MTANHHAFISTDDSDNDPDFKDDGEAEWPESDDEEVLPEDISIEEEQSEADESVEFAVGFIFFMCYVHGKKITNKHVNVEICRLRRSESWLLTDPNVPKQLLLLDYELALQRRSGLRLPHREIM